MYNWPHCLNVHKKLKLCQLFLFSLSLSLSLSHWILWIPRLGLVPNLPQFAEICFLFILFAQVLRLVMTFPNFFQRLCINIALIVSSTHVLRSLTLLWIAHKYIFVCVASAMKYFVCCKQFRPKFMNKTHLLEINWIKRSVEIDVCKLYAIYM